MSAMSWWGGPVAGALRPVVLLMLLASVLFVGAGVLDGVYPGGPHWTIADLAALSYFFALLNTLVAILVARGSETSLAARIGLALFFVFERPISALFFDPKTAESIAVHLLTALIELVILVTAFRVWQLGRSLPAEDVDELLSLDGAVPGRGHVADDDARAEATALPMPSRTAWILGATTLLLAVVLVTDGASAGFLPGGRDWGLTGGSSGWLVYLFAVVLLTVATRAVRGGRVALRLLFATALIFFVERAFSPFALRITDPLALGLHALAALVALAVALACANAIRGDRGHAERDVTSFETA